MSLLSIAGCLQVWKLATLLEKVIYKSVTDTVGQPNRPGSQTWNPIPEPSFMAGDACWSMRLVFHFLCLMWGNEMWIWKQIPAMLRRTWPFYSYFEIALFLPLFILAAFSVSRRKYFIRKISVLDAFWHPPASNKTHHKLKMERTSPGNKEMEPVGIFFFFTSFKVCMLFQCQACHRFL